MNKKYTQEDIIKGFKNLEKIRQENQQLKAEKQQLQNQIAAYEAKEVGMTMISMGFTDIEARTALSMLRRALVLN